MTTIIVDQELGFMAADKMVTANEAEFAIPCDTKIQRVKVGADKYLVGLAGLESSGQYFLNWFERDEWDWPPEPLSEIEDADTFSVIVLGPRGIEIADKFCLLTPIQYRWYAVGTGGPIAWAILEAGCDIHKAMETALRMDPSSGFGYEVKYLNGKEETVGP